ncbi:ATP-dependent DNA ligase [Gordonibacter sp.]|uniref:ATP-dependent DNA ligase n=1 Tax=Gordonibacter sp. TaxID=1968902 RepID=UPI002FC84D7E
MGSTRPELDSYHRKCDFELTPEPEGAVDEPQGTLRFVIRLLIKEKDEYVRGEAGFFTDEASIRTGRTMQEIAQGASERLTRNPFHEANVQLAKLVDRVPPGDEWLYEVKYDGNRAFAYLEENSARLASRNGLDYTDRFPTLAASLAGRKCLHR